MTSSSDFEKWCESLGVDLGDASDEVETEKRHKFLCRWLRNLYDYQGPLAKDLVYASFLLDQIQLATDNVAVVLGDIERTTILRPDILVDDYDGAIRVAFNESYTTPSLWIWENPDALAEVADYLQEHVIEQLWAVWPTCAKHGFGVFAEVHSDVAAWWCRYGDHAVAPVGQLGGL